MFGRALEWAGSGLESFAPFSSSPVCITELTTNDKTYSLCCLPALQQCFHSLVLQSCLDDLWSSTSLLLLSLILVVIFCCFCKVKSAESTSHFSLFWTRVLRNYPERIGTQFSRIWTSYFRSVFLMVIHSHLLPLTWNLYLLLCYFL